MRTRPPLFELKLPYFFFPLLQLPAILQHNGKLAHQVLR